MQVKNKDGTRDVVGGREPKSWKLESETTYVVTVPEPKSPAHRRAIQLGLLEDARKRYVCGVESLAELAGCYELPKTLVKRVAAEQRWDMQRRERLLRLNSDWLEKDRARVAHNTALFVGEVDEMNAKFGALIRGELGRMQKTAELRGEEGWDVQTNSLFITDMLRLSKAMAEFVSVGRKNLGMDEHRETGQKLLGPAVIDVEPEDMPPQ